MAAPATTAGYVAPANLPDFSIGQEDLNGECFILGAEGEVEELIEKNEVIFSPHMPAASAGGERKPVQFANDQANEFLAVNIAHSVAAGRTPRDAAVVAYVRMLAARNGLISPDFSPAAHNVRYNHAIRVSAARRDALLGKFNTDAGLKDAALAALSNDVRVRCRKYFSDIVCCVAYIFRVRGHHYRDDIQEKYSTLWNRCLHRDADLPASWELLATDALHAVMPDVLDEYWQDCANNARCAGALIKRLDSAPAGVAGVLALQRGLDDVRMLFPGVVNQVPEAYDEFQHVVHQLHNSRWGGSINCRFYGVPRIRVNEGRIGALASVVMGIYEQLAPESQLRNSMALRRLAQIAPATGGAIGLAARRTVQSEQLTLIGATSAALPPAGDAA